MRWSTALVTGASSGIGAAIAEQLAARGCGVVLVARDGARLEALAARLREEGAARGGPRVEVLPADLRSTAGLAAVVARLGAADDPVDLLVNNAGITTYGPFLSQEIGTAIAQVELHVEGPMRLAHAAGRAMARRGRGAILNVASTAALQPAPGLAAYAASKAALVSFSESLGAELRADGVTVTCLCPGYTRTELQARAGVDASALPSAFWLDAPEVARVGLEACERGRARAVPGRVNRAAAAVSRYAPRAVSGWMAARTIAQVRSEPVG